MHVYAHLFEGKLGQYTYALRQPGAATRLRTPSRIVQPTTDAELNVFARNVPYLRSPSEERTRPCRGTMSFNEKHTHYIYTDPNILQPIIGSGFDAATLPSVYVSWQDVRAGVARDYKTTTQNNHLHSLRLTAADFATLRSGGTVTKVTSNNRSPTGRLHTHTVRLSCRADAVL
jgi:hypothetical protein